MKTASKKTLKLFLASLSALIVCYFLAFFAFPNQISTRIYVLAVFAFAVACGYFLGSLRRDRQVWHLVNDLKLQIQTKETAQEKLMQADLRLKHQNEALATLTASQLTDWKKPEEVFKQITELSAKTLEIERVGFWLFSENQQTMHCADMYHRSTGQHTSGAILSAADFPRYFHALSTQRVITAHDAKTNSATSEFASDYLPSNNIGAMLDGTIWLNEKVVGVVCHEHVGGAREWTLDEQNFAGSMADLGRLTIETNRRRLVEAELLKHRDLLEETVRVRTTALENNAKTYQFLVERASVSILYMNRATEVLEMNPETTLVSGYSREHAIGKTFYELFSNKEIRKHHVALFKRILDGEKLQGLELLMRRADGIVSEYSISASLEVDADGNPVIVSISQDKSAQKALERSLIVAREAAESADRIKSMFVASMSHELRTPLNSIIGFLGVVLQGMSGAINDKQKEQLGRAYGSAKHLLSLISDVIDISKIEAGYLQVHVEKFALLPLLIEVEQVIHHIAAEKEIEISIECVDNMMLDSDRKRLYQVVLNVMSNAVKYTEKGAVHVKAVIDKKWSIITVQDTGIGIDDADLANLFKPFERADSRLRIKTLGTGLGLYLTHKILTQLLGGTISVESKPEVGSVFTIKLPLKAPEISIATRSILEGQAHDHSFDH